MDNRDAHSGERDQEVYLYHLPRPRWRACLVTPPVRVRLGGIFLLKVRRSTRPRSGRRRRGWRRPCPAGRAETEKQPCISRGICRIRAACFLIVVMGLFLRM